jgi:hypothetical protein
MPIGHTPHDNDAQLNFFTDKSEPTPSTPQHHHDIVDLGTLTECPTPASFESHTDNEQDRPFATPFFSPSSPTVSSHGCEMSTVSKDGPRTTLQPHELVSNNNYNKNKKQLTTIYTQNAQDLWRRPRDQDGNILVDKPPDLFKLEYLIDYMRQNDVGAWLC